MSAPLIAAVLQGTGHNRLIPTGIPGVALDPTSSTGVPDPTYSAYTNAPFVATYSVVIKPADGTNPPEVQILATDPKLAHLPAKRTSVLASVPVTQNVRDTLTTAGITNPRLVNQAVRLAQAAAMSPTWKDRPETQQKAFSGRVEGQVTPKKRAQAQGIQRQRELRTQKHHIAHDADDAELSDIDAE